MIKLTGNMRCYSQYSGIHSHKPNHEFCGVLITGDTITQTLSLQTPQVLRLCGDVQ